MELLHFLCRCVYHNLGPSENQRINGCVPSESFGSLAGTCAGGVLGIVSPALLDDPDSLSTNPSLTG